MTAWIPNWWNENVIIDYTGSEGVISHECNRLIVIWHRFRLIWADRTEKISRNISFWRNKHRKWLQGPSVNPAVVVIQMRKSTVGSREIIYNKFNWLIVCKYSSRLIRYDKILRNTYFRQNQHHKWPHESPMGEMKMWLSII